MKNTNFDYEPLLHNEEIVNAIATKPVSYWQDAWRRLKQNRFALVSLVVILLMVFLALVGPLLSSYTYSEQNLEAVDQWPSTAHWFGTDGMGRDLFVRVLNGTRLSLTIGLVATFINIFIGVLYGGVSGLLGGKIDRLMMSVVEILYGIPSMIYVILLMVVLKPGLLSIYLAMGISHWLGMARMVRGQILSLREQEFILAARTMGASPLRILLQHLIPNILGIIVINITFAIPGAIFTEAFLSFIGLGVPPPMASLGTLSREGADYIRTYTYQLIFPAMSISIMMLAFNYLGEGLRDALDPRMRR